MAYFGGKTRLADQIVALLPPHEHYVEPFAGSLAVLLAKPLSRLETVNDLDGDLMLFWRVLRDRPEDLMRACALTPHCRVEHDRAYTASGDDVERARRVWVRITQGRTGTLRRTGWRYYVDPAGTSVGMPGYLEGYVDRMAAAAERLHRVSLECMRALDVVVKYAQHSTTCLYVDPPYLGTVRDGTNYQTEMHDEASHLALLDALVAARAGVVVSGYRSALYDARLSGWARVEIPSATGQGGSYRPRTEVIWTNRDVPEIPVLF